MDATQRALFLRKIHLFHELKDDQLVQIGVRFTEESFDAGEMILKQGEIADSFYLIYSGNARIYRYHEGREQELAVLVSGDYFGEMEVLAPRGARSASASALTPTLLLRITKEEFAEVLKAYPTLKPNLEIAIASRKLARTLRFKWLRKDEVVYFLARKHPFFLVQTLAPPVLALFVPIYMFIWGALAGSIAAIAFGGVLIAIILAWGAWNAVDWGNDYYVVTNQRVVWLERVIGLYDSRNEAPLSQILSVGVDTDMVGRILDYGDVFVRTFVGSIPFRRVPRPQQAAHMVEEYWHRTQQISEQAEKEAFKTALRQRLGLLEPSETEKAPPKKEEKTAFPLYKPNIFRILGANLFKVRLEEGAIITYRKHWFVLLQQVFLPSVIFLGLLGIWIARLITIAISPELALIQTLPDGSLAADTIAVSLPLLLLPVLGWWIYQYLDWTNDIFRVTNEQIMDIDRKPFGTEVRRAAPLDNILGTRYERLGILGYLINFGTVYIDVGSAQFAFEDVLDPAGVQADVDRRRLMREASKKEAERTAERNRMADWMAAYHRNVEELRLEQELKNTKPKTE